jgi:hypothetical protein
VADIVAVEVDKGTEQLLHDHCSFFLSQMFSLNNKVEEFATLAIPTKEINLSEKIFTRAQGSTRRSTPRFRAVLLCVGDPIIS